jgi:membrane protease YdiL (CAAX protease family)
MSNDRTSARPTSILDREQTSMAKRYAHVAAFLALWMALGWLFRLDPYRYLLLGVPLTIGFQLMVRRFPLCDCWVRGTQSVPLSRQLILLAIAFAAVPCFHLLKSWPNSRWPLQAYLVLSLLGAVGVAFAVCQFTRNTGRALLMCLGTAGLAGCGMMLLVAYARRHGLDFSFKRTVTVADQFLVLLPICFVLEEVTFRGVLDSHLASDSQSLSTAFVLSAMWGWWHLPIAPPSAIPAAIFVFPITHAVMGVPMSLYWRRSGNLLVPALTHALIDAVRNGFVRQ